jgi:hypothetical protein
MTPEAKGATAEGFTRGEHRPTVRGEARPEDWNEAPRRRASEHSRERPEGEGMKPHPRKATRQASGPATKKTHLFARCSISRGGIGGSRAPPLAEPAPAAPMGERTQRQPAAAARLAEKPTPRLDCHSAGQRGERSDDHGAERGEEPTECALKHYPLAGIMPCGFAIRRNEGRAIRPAPKRNIFKGGFYDRDNRRPP